MIGYIIMFVLMVIMALCALRIRQGMNENYNTPVAIIIFVICMALLCSLEVK